MNLNISSWGNFKISELFPALQNGKANQGMLSDGYDCFYVGAKKDDNGVMLHCAYDSALIQKGNCIIFICNGQGSVGYANYMDVDFIGSTDIVAGYNKMLNQYNGLFIATVLCQERPKYSFGRKWKTHLKDTVIKLPQTIEGFPDWDFMEQYIKSLNHKPLTTQNRHPQHQLDIESWQEFLVSDIFEIHNGKFITKEEIDENPGDFCAVQSGEENNGILGKIDKQYCMDNGYIYTDQPCLTVARSGSAGYVSYQNFGCVVGDSAKILLLKDSSWRTPYIYLFFKTLLMANKFKYTYGRKVTEDKYLNEIINLPVKLAREGDIMIDTQKKYSAKGFVPDFEFMENYIKSLPYGDRI